jgi:O-antigen/teichoic acid export membrane protein
VAISRGLGPEGRGTYSLAILTALVLTTLGKLGIEHANVYLLGTVRVGREKLASQNFLVSAITGIPAILLMIAAPLLLPSVFADTPVVYLALAGITIPFAIHAQLAAGLQNLTGLVTWQFRAQLVGALAQLLIAGGLAAVGRLDVPAALVSNVAGTVLAWALIVTKDGWATLWLRADLGLLSRSLRYSLVVHTALVLLFLETRLNVFLVKAFLGTGAVGQYTVSVSLAEAFLLAADSLAITMLPHQTAGRLADAARLGLTGAKVGGLVTAAAIVPGIVLGLPTISLLFGEAFAPSYVPFALLLPGMVLLAMQRYFGPPALRANDPGRIARIYLIGVVANLLLNLWWIPMWGLGGAAAATTASYAITVALFLRWTLELARE